LKMAMIRPVVSVTQDSIARTRSAGMLNEEICRNLQVFNELERTYWISFKVFANGYQG
jgi:hypothetical protein